MRRLGTCLLTVSLVCIMAVSAFAADETYTMAFMPGIADAFYYTMEKGAQAKADELGVKLIVGEYPKGWGPEYQVPILEALVARGDVDLLFTAPTSTEALIPVLKKVHDSGIPVITVDTYLGDGDYTKESEYSFPLAYIGTDNFAGGKVVAEHLAEMIDEQGKVMVENTNPDVSSVQGREKGFVAGMEDYPDIDVVAIEYCLDNQEKAQAQVAAVLQKHPDLAGVFGVNIFSAQGAYRAIVNAGLTGAVKVATWDATEDLINALRKGEVDLVLAQKPAEIGSLAVEWGLKYLQDGTPIPNKKLTPGFFVFTKENVDDPDAQQYIYSK
ncbi:substrate-binding domain-containing protein [candidate division KSB3 bacterium]|uniref:Substrate-binding domain-containing protein n=1 Tax=candidate division KSB3 bacterium TaxID=2044937 RepID=A0A9D5Q638_9BACT|nr:substrate-binding domain-containing protein [candidate division KSB3 bacterium]MBD3325305.1 substrate-binding domain-containing protein [candidate division KSB3 bacterium]